MPEEFRQVQQRDPESKTGESKPDPQCEKRGDCSD